MFGEPIINDDPAGMALMVMANIIVMFLFVVWMVWFDD